MSQQNDLKSQASQGTTKTRKHAIGYCYYCWHSGGKNNMPKHFKDVHDGISVKYRESDQEPVYKDMMRTGSTKFQPGNKAHQKGSISHYGGKQRPPASAKEPSEQSQVAQQDPAVRVDDAAEEQVQAMSPLGAMTRQPLFTQQQMQHTPELIHIQPVMSKPAQLNPIAQQMHAADTPTNPTKDNQQSKKPKTGAARPSNNLQIFMMPLPKKRPKHQSEFNQGSGSPQLGHEFDIDMFKEVEQLYENKIGNKLQNALYTNKESYWILPQLLQSAEQLLTEDVFKLVRTKPQRLRELLYELKPSIHTTTEQMCGIVLALLQYGAELLKLIPLYTNLMSREQRASFDGLLRQHLKMVYLNDSVVKWVAENLDHLTEPIYDLTMKLEANQNSYSYQILQAARISELSADVNLFIGICERLISYKRFEWLTKSLEIYPDQKMISYTDFFFTVEKLGKLQLYKLLDTKKAEVERFKIHEWLDMIQTFEDEAGNLDQLTITQNEALGQLKSAYTTAYDEELLQQLSKSQASLMFKDMRHEPCPMQVGVAMFVTGLLKKSKKVMFQLNPGSGKSRIIPGIAGFALSYCSKAFKRVHIVIPGESLKNRDLNDFKDFFENNDLSQKVFYHTDIAFSRKLGDLVLIDEADSFIYQDPKTFKTFISTHHTVCFSATPTVASECEREKAVLAHMELDHYVYRYKNELDTSKLHFKRTLPQMDQVALIKFLQDKASRSSVLLYTSDATITALQEANVMTTVINDDFSDHQMLKQLDKKSGSSFPIIATCKPWAMRGFDYRAKTFGVCLVVDKGFQSQRDRDQGLARVGRFQDQCERLITHKTEELDKQMNQKFIKAMNQFILFEEQKAMKSAQKETTGLMSTRAKPLPQPEEQRKPLLKIAQQQNY